MVQPLIQEGKVNVVMDGQWGSTGKGKLYGWLYHHFPSIKVAVCDFTPNAGHTFIDSGGTNYVSKILPIGTLFESVELAIIGPHAVFDPERLEKELLQFRHRGKNATVAIHPLAMILVTRDIADEARTMSHIASTMQGGCAAQIKKMMRNPKNCEFAKDHPKIKHMVTDTHALLQDRLRRGQTALIETAQGFDLGLSNGWEWPFVTSRDCMVGRVLDNAGVSPKRLGSIIASLRTYPIRVGNIGEASVSVSVSANSSVDGYSGPWYPDQHEITWEWLSERIGRKVCEMTTVTKRVRRVFTWSNQQIDRFCAAVEPDFAFINFVNYYNRPELIDLLWDIHIKLKENQCEPRLWGTGAGLSDMCFDANIDEVCDKVHVK